MMFARKVKAMIKAFCLIFLLAIWVIYSANVIAKNHNNQQDSIENQEHHTSKPVIGIASFYSDKFNGKRTASGEKFNNSAMTAAHKTLPFGSRVEVTNLRNKKSVVVRINDRGPYIKSRNIDLSKAAARQIGLGHRGTAKVRLQILD
jgi:rare lipoprotein A